MDVLCPKMKDPTTIVMTPHAVKLNLQGRIKHIPFILRPSTEQVQFDFFIYSTRKIINSIIELLPCYLQSYKVTLNNNKFT